MNLGLFIIPIRYRNQTSYPFDYLEFCSDAEKYGYTEVYIGEHLTDAREDIRSSMIFGAALAAKTKNIKICLSVLPLPHYNIDLLVSQLKDLYYLTEGRLKIGLGPGALNSDLEYLNINVNKRYEIFQNKLKDFINKIELDNTSFNNLRKNIFSTVLSPNPTNSSKLRELDIKILSSNFSSRRNLQNHIYCYSADDFLSSNLNSWTISHNYFNNKFSEKSKKTILSSIQYIHNKLGIKASSIMGIEEDLKFTDSSLNDYKNIIELKKENFWEYINNSTLFKKSRNHVLNVFDCLDDDKYVDSLIQIGNEFKLLN
mgnify:CR=1 FL=1